MSTQTGKFTRALSLTGIGVVKMFSDAVNIPFAGSKYKTGLTTAVVANKLVDSGANFLSTGVNALNVQVGDTVWNTTDGICAYVRNVDNATTLSLTIDIFQTAASKQYQLFSSSDMWIGSTPNCYLYVGYGGDGTVLTAGGDEVRFQGVTAGTVLPVQVSRVYNSGTPTWEQLVALW